MASARAGEAEKKVEEVESAALIIKVVELELREVERRMGDESSPLREEAVGVLHKTLLSLHSHISSLSSSSASSLLLLLLHELQSLKSLIPPTYSQGDEGSTTSCVISSALDYLEKSSNILQVMKEGMQEFTSLSKVYFEEDLFPIKDHSFCNVDHVGNVTVDSLHDAKLHILVHCKKRVGLLNSLILAFDTLGLVIDQMDISSDDIFQMDVITTQVDAKAIDNGMLRRTLSKIVCEGC